MRKLQSAAIAEFWGLQSVRVAKCWGAESEGCRVWGLWNVGVVCVGVGVAMCGSCCVEVTLRGGCGV